ncbi:Tn3 family transposase [Streptomyces massasporeus]|uniref:Tn3 family transposase n=1 Tax=Streptomyces massasporeus TaxID=67324 RepID=UPI0036A615D4
MRHGTTMEVEAYTHSHWPVGNRVRHHEAAELRPAAQGQADQQGEAVAAGGRRAGRLPATGPGADPPDPLGTHRPAVRPDDQVRDRDPDPGPRPPRRSCAASPATPPPTCAAILEVGRAQKAILVARYLRLRDLQRENEEGLNVMESSNGANSVIAYGEGGEITSNRRDEQEMFVRCLRILQSALVYVNTLMLQDTLGEPE